jgi:hypothetical protein
VSYDAEHAEMIKQAVAGLNKACLDAARTGLEVELEVAKRPSFGLGNVSLVNYRVSRTVKRG